MKIGVLTSSRADYGIYLPLLNLLKNDDYYDLEIIAFGTHLSPRHGMTIDNIKDDGYKKIHKVYSLEDDDSEKGISISYGVTIIKFAEFWESNKFNLILCLGDRFEMSAAVQASIPFGVKLAHIHGGEMTLGAIDNIYRHQITIASTLHFTSSKTYSNKVEKILGFNNNVYDVGALSLSNIDSFIPLPRKRFFEKFNIKDDVFCLVTFHPETKANNFQEKFALVMQESLEIISKKINLVITMPNADTMGSVFRKRLLYLKSMKTDNVFIVENFGKEGYFSAMFYAEFLLGNTSSGIIEAASFKKYVVNVGDRQAGRTQSGNVINTKFSTKEIVEAAFECLSLGRYFGKNVYFKNNTANKIIKILKANGH